MLWVESVDDFRLKLSFKLSLKTERVIGLDLYICRPMLGLLMVSSV